MSSNQVDFSKFMPSGLEWNMTFFWWMLICSLHQTSSIISTQFMLVHRVVPVEAWGPKINAQNLHLKIKQNEYWVCSSTLINNLLF